MELKIEELTNFLKKHYPKAWSNYIRSSFSWDKDLKPGTVVLTLKAGFSGGRGEFRVVTEEVDKGPTWEAKILKPLSNNSKCKSMLLKVDNEYNEFWWQTVAIVDYEYYKKLNYKDKRKFVKNILEGKQYINHKRNKYE